MKGFGSKSKTKTPKTKKVKRIKSPAEKKHHRRVVLNSILITIIVIGLIGLAAGGTIIYSIIKSSSITLNVSDFKASENTIIYDKDNNVIATVGVENRINITYDQLPQVVVDAFVSIEDSRFFVHNGFDIPRFTKSAINNLKSMSFSQGGSTFTMQMIKNTYFVTEEQLAPKSVSRKVQEIYFALQIEKLISKQKIFELYINKINFGGTSRGIQSASNYYFGKDCSELTLNEAAILAGVINGPNDLNPYYNVDWCTERRNEVLYQMVNHGYITQEEANIAEKVNVEDVLVGESNGYADTTTDALQSYVDKVLNEVEELTGEDPYTSSMRIYTAMDRRTQDMADSICQGNQFSFPDDYYQTGFAVLNHTTGEIVALGGGRGRTGERTFSFATDARKSPGSSIKPILDYALAFEYAGITTEDWLTDEKIYWQGSSIQIYNADSKYHGEVSLQHALSASYNIPAILLLRKVRNAVSDDVIKQYMKTIGFDEDVADAFTEQYAIGGASLTVSPLQMAAAQGMLMNGGVYIEPHCVTRIEYIDGSQEPYVPTYTGVQVISPAAAYCIASMMEKNVSNDIYLGNVKAIKHNYQVYAKTGTSDWGTAGRQYGIPTTAIKDHWMNASTSQFTIATWTGYDKAVEGQTNYMSWNTYNKNIVAKIDNLMLDSLEASYGTPASITAPADLASATHVKGTWPYLAPPSWCPSEYIVTGYTKGASVGTWPTPTINEITSFSAAVKNGGVDTQNTTNGHSTSISFTVGYDAYPADTTDYKKADNGLTSNYYKVEVDGTVVYAVDVYIDGTLVATRTTTSPNDTITITLDNLSEGTHDIQFDGYYTYTIAPVKSGVISRTDTITVTVPFIPENP